MKQCGLLLLLAFVCVHCAPAKDLPPSSCKDATTVFVAEEALDKINKDRTTGYIFSLERVSNVHQRSHGETGVVYYLTLDVLESKCHVLSKKSYKECENRGIGGNPVYGQCKAVIYVNKPHRVSRLYKYSCSLRPVSASKIYRMCPDCPVLVSLENEDVKKTVQLGLEKLNSESRLPNYFAPLNITRAIAQLALIRMFRVEFTIQETVCSNKTALSEASKCDLMTCEFAHTGFCTAAHTVTFDNKEFLEANCEIYEPQAAEEEKKRHLQVEKDHDHKNISGASHSHDHTHKCACEYKNNNDKKKKNNNNHHGHDHTHAEGETHEHVHTADHKGEHKNNNDKKKKNNNNHQGHDHTHAEGETHEHVHTADHKGEHKNNNNNKKKKNNNHHGHNHTHAEGETHEHDHEHRHGHLHEHEHHHHHHHHIETTIRKPDRAIHILPSLDRPVTLPVFPDQDEDPDTHTGLALRPDPQIPGQTEPVIGTFPKTVSPNCPAEFKTNDKLLLDAFAEDPKFKVIPAA